MKISRMAAAVIAVALLAFLATDVMAQRGGGRPGGGRPGGGGPGGPGFGGGFGGFRGSASLGQSAMMYLRVDAVKAEIELMPDQEEGLKKMAENQPRPERPDFDFREATEEQRNEFFAKIQKQREEAAKKMQEDLEEILLPDQYDRLKEICIQQLDVRALDMTEVAEALKITEAQKKEMEELRQKQRDEGRDQMRKIFEEVGREGIRDAMAKYQEENNAKILAVLTSAQKSDFEKMKGEKFEMPEDAMRQLFSGGRGGQGGGRGGFGGRGGDGGGGRGGRGGDGGERRRPTAEE